MIKLFLIHFVADFLLQPREMGKKKSSNWYYLLAHLCIQFVAFLPFTGFKFAFFNALIHGVIDKNIWNLYKGLCHFKLRRALKKDPTLNMQDQIANFKYWEDHWFYATIGLDQFLHAATIIYLSRFL